MSIGWSIVAGIALMTSLGWLVGCIYSWTQMGALRRASELDVDAGDSWPTVSVLVPARNEADSIARTLRSLVDQNYPALEVIAIDDRSDDGTGAIMDRLADEYDSIRTVHIGELPDGWIGKTHALHRGVAAAGGEWLLFTDGDVQFAPEASKKLVSVADREELDHLACLPNMVTSGFWHEVTYAGFLVMTILTGTDLRAIQEPENDAYLGIGAFNLVRTEFFESTEGLEWLRMEVMDDLGIGRLVSRHGGRQDVLFAFDLLELEWYDGVASMVRGFEKNTFGALGHYSFGRVAGLVLGWTLFSLGPLAGLAVPGVVIPAVCVAVFAGLLVNLVVLARFAERPVVPMMLSFAGIWIMMFALLRSTVLFAVRGGIEWRDTFYPADQLRAHQRVRVF